MLDPRAELANSHVEQFDPFRSTNDNYGTWGPWNFGARARKTAQNYENYRNNVWDEDEGVQFRPLKAEDDRSGVHSPPLWTTTPPRSPVHPRHHVNNYRTLSPTSKTQAIARGQRELMEMVKNMPEACYELSLKDLVEQPRVETQEECLLQEKNYDDHQQQFVAHQRVDIKRQESKKNEKRSHMTRSGSMDNRGLFLKMVFPISLKSKKKKNVNSPSTCAKVSPKPEISDRTSKSVDKDWWKKRFSASSESDSSGRSSSNNNGSTGSSGSSGSSGSGSGSGGGSGSGSGSGSSNSIRKKSGFFISCLPCFRFTKGNTAK